MKILFLTKKNECYSFRTNHRRSSGLWNSIQFIVSELKKHSINVGIEEVVDGNCINKWLTIYKPKILVLEALWVTPEKIRELKGIHKNVKFVCRLHSGIPFLALEGIALEWVLAYAKLGVTIAANSKESFDALSCVVKKKDITYLPNIYPVCGPLYRYTTKRNYIRVVCAGAIRPMKNHLIQALAAIQYAKEVKKELYFHVNSTRIETGGEPVLKNLRALFKEHTHAHLVEDAWRERTNFRFYLGDMDLGMQVSLTETFSIVSADYVSAMIPMVVSKEISWASCLSKAPDNDVGKIVKAMHRAMRWSFIVTLNRFLLHWYSYKSTKIWLKFLKSK